MDLLSILAVVLAAACFGAMLFFSLGVAPIVFRVLDMEAGGRFVRALFPAYYAMCGSIAATASLAALGRWPGWVLLLTSLLFVYLRQSLLPAINRARDAGKEGSATAAARFERLHRVSVGLNGLQLALLVIAIAGLVLA